MFNNIQQKINIKIIIIQTILNKKNLISSFNGQQYPTELKSQSNK